MRREGAHTKEWHFSQNSVFFHAVDNQDTSRTAVVLTTNRRDLVDEAIRDRFLEYEFGLPTADLLVELAVRFATGLLPDGAAAEVADRALAAVAAGTLRSMRDAQRFAMTDYVESVIGRGSLRRR